MQLDVVRSFKQDVLDRLSHLSGDRFNVELVDVREPRSNFCPLYCVTTVRDKNRDKNRGRKEVLISAGIHGEEPAGVYALLKFLEEDVQDFLDDYRFMVFPCINPFGFEHNHRFSPAGLNINRQFGIKTVCREANAVVMTLVQKMGRDRFICTIDLHETDPNFVGEGFKPEDNPKGFYMWEVCPDRGLRIGDRVIESIEEVVPVCKWDSIYKDKNSGGVIWYPEGCGNPVYAQGTTLEAYLNANYTSQSFTLETPCGWHMNQRIFAHRAALRKILELKRDA